MRQAVQQEQKAAVLPPVQTQQVDAQTVEAIATTTIQQATAATAPRVPLFVRLGPLLFAGFALFSVWGSWQEPGLTTVFYGVGATLLIASIVPATRHRTHDQHARGEWFALPLYWHYLLQTLAFLLFGLTQFLPSSSSAAAKGLGSNPFLGFLMLLSAANFIWLTITK